MKLEILSDIELLKAQKKFALALGMRQPLSVSPEMIDECEFMKWYEQRRWIAEKYSKEYLEEILFLHQDYRKKEVCDEIDSIKLFFDDDEIEHLPMYSFVALGGISKPLMITQNPLERAGAVHGQFSYGPTIVGVFGSSEDKDFDAKCEFLESLRTQEPYFKTIDITTGNGFYIGCASNIKTLK